MTRIAVIGASGQLGSRMCELLGSRAVAVTRKQMELESDDSITECLDALQPRAIVNMAAYTNVEKAEDEIEKAYRINAEAAAHVAAWAFARNVPYVTCSTDYVFDGTKGKPYVETDQTHALSAYGASKERGETLVMAANTNALILRISWLYDARGANFFTTIADKLQGDVPLRVVNDQRGTPCFAPDIARTIVTMLEKPLSSGIHHLVHEGDTSWYGFANAIRDALQRYVHAPLVPIMPVPSSAYPTRAARPADSRLDASLLYRTQGIRLPLWKDAVERAVRERYAH